MESEKQPGDTTTQSLSVTQHIIDGDDNNISINNDIDNNDDENLVEKGDKLNNGSIDDGDGVGVNGSFETDPVGETVVNDGIIDGVEGVGNDIDGDGDASVENNDSLPSGVVENNDNLPSGVVEDESSGVSGVEKGEALASGVVEEEDSVMSGVEKNVSLPSGVVEEGLVGSGVEKDDSLASGVVEDDSVGSGVENNDSLASGVTEDGGAELGNESGAIVDSINVDVVEAVRSGVAVVGVEEGEVKPVDESGSGSVFESPNVVEPSDVKVEKSNDREVDLGNEETAVLGDVQQSAPVEEPKASENDLVKSTGEEDSVVDEILVDPVEVVRSGIAVVGDSGGEKTDAEVNEAEASVGENVALENEFEPLVSATEEPITDNDVESVELQEHVDGDQVQQVDDIKPETNVGSGTEEPITDNDVESVELQEHVDGDQVQQVDDVKPETNVGSEPAGASQHVEMSERGFAPQGGDETQIVPESEEEAESDEEGEEKELFDSAALAALLKAATSAGSGSGTVTITSQDGSRLFSVERPAGLGSSLRPLRPAARPSNSTLVQSNRFDASEENLSKEERKKLEQMHQLRIKFLRLVQRLGFSEEDSIASQVLYRLALLGGRPTSLAFSLENAKQTAVQLETEGKGDLDFSLTILVIGKAGVGKSATINSIFGEEKVKINAFEPETTVQEVSGVIDRVKIRVIDAPGLRSSGMDQGFNRKILASVKKLMKKYPPDVMLYVDRLDTQTRDLNDLPVLRTITSSLGSSIWRSAIVTLTHAACAPPDGPSGSPLSYEVFVANRSHIVQQFIGQAVGDLRVMNPSLMNPVSLVENHLACRKNRDGQRVLPNGQAWRPQLLLMCYSLKILSEANASLKTQDTFDHRKLFGFRVRSAPLPYLLSTLLQPRAHPKLSVDQGGDGIDSDVDLDDLSDSDQEEEDEYDQLPPFKPLRKSQLAKLSRDQRKAYFEEYDYRVKLLQKKQWREELKRMRQMKKGKNDVQPEDYDAENEAPAAVPVPLPDMVLPPSFDSDNPAYRYRFLEPTSQFLARPVLDTHGWDHDCGYDGVNLEQNLGIAGQFPASVTVQVTKDKKECNIHLDSAVSAKHGEHGSSLVGFDVQTIGKQPAYIIRAETKSKLLKNKAGAGVAVTFLGENVSTGVKVEDQLNLGKRLVLVGSAGTVRSQKDAAYGANMELRLREADYPIGQDQSSLSLSLMKWRGDLAIGGNLQSQLSVGRNSKMGVRCSLNNKRSGQISVKISSSDHLQLAMAGLVPIALSICRIFKPSVSDHYSLY